MVLDKTEARIHQMAVQIADEAARADIETMCAVVTNDGAEPATLHEIRSAWYDTAVTVDGATGMIRRAVAYLTLRGKIVRHPFREGWIQVRNWREGTSPPKLK